MKLCKWLLIFVVIIIAKSLAKAESALSAYYTNINFTDVFNEADSFGPMEGIPPAAAAWRDERIVGYVFEASDTGYSGKPLRILVGLDTSGTIVGARILEHHEPILLAGIPKEKLLNFIDSYIGSAVIKINSMPKKPISGATVTAIVVHDAVRRIAIQVARSRGLAWFKSNDSKESGSVRPANLPFTTVNWNTLLDEGAIQRLVLTQADVDAAFHRSGASSPESYTTSAPSETVFIDIYTSLITPENIGRNILDKVEYENLLKELKSGEQAIVIAANGRYSFRGSGFVRGGIFDRIQVVQDENTLLFRDSHYKRIGSLKQGTPAFEEIGLFRLSDGSRFDPLRPWRLDLLVQRQIGPIEKIYTSFSLFYTLPKRYIERLQPPINITTTQSFTESKMSSPVWTIVWWNHLNEVITLSVVLLLLTAIFFFQDTLVCYPRVIDYVRILFLLFTVLWIGGYTQSQLSVIHVLTFVNALTSTFRLDSFLLDPIVFILWSWVAVALLFWGRGAYCGWLCPFGSMQELLFRLVWKVLASRCRIRPNSLAFGLHERLLPLKYILFLSIFVTSLYSMATAELLAEIEPFKTVILLQFSRPWQFVIYALILLGVGLFIERFFCRYLCPLGGALAIPARLRIFEWLRRRHQCGKECSICARRCGVQAIYYNGTINTNECFYCLKCQVNYFNVQVCPPLIIHQRGGAC